MTIDQATKGGPRPSKAAGLPLRVGYRNREEPRKQGQFNHCTSWEKLKKG